MAVHASPSSGPPYSLQWGHGREAMDGGIPEFPAGRGPVLQWGHGREAMDGGIGTMILGGATTLQWGHGREAMDGSYRLPRPEFFPDFNGAMAVRPWMACTAF